MGAVYAHLSVKERVQIERWKLAKVTGRGLTRKDAGGNRPTPLRSKVMGVALQVARTQ